MTKQQERILCKVLGIETLEERKMDSLDFHDMAVWTIKNAVELAYEMGKADGENS